MLRDGAGVSKVYIAVGYTDMRSGIDSLIYLVHNQFGLDPLDKGTLFLFCGKESDRIKALLYEGDGFLLLYKRLVPGYRFQWPRSSAEVKQMTREEFDLLMKGFNPYQEGRIGEASLTRIG